MKDIHYGPLLAHGFADFPPGQVSAAWTNGETEWNISYTLSGHVREQLGASESSENPHDFMILKPGGCHEWSVPAEANEPWRVVFFIFVPKPEWIPLLDLPEELPRFSRVPLAGRRHAAKIRRALLQAHRLAGSPGGGSALAMNAIERALLWLGEELAETNARLDPRVQTAMELFAKRLANPPSMAETAATCGVSTSRLTELFQACTGQPPRLWLERTRLNHGRNLLLTTGLPVKLVAAACGYPDQRHFATRFRRCYGITPGECREQRHMG